MEAQNHEQPQPAKPARPRRKWLRWLAVPAAVAVLVTAYRLTRPPELVWWRSDPIGEMQFRVRMLVPNGWGVSSMTPLAIERSQGFGLVSLPQGGVTHSGEWEVEYHFFPEDHSPRFLQKLFNSTHESGTLLVVLNKPERGVTNSVYEVDRPTQVGEVEIGQPLPFRTRRMWADIQYKRSNLAAFNRTYKQICNSLTIE